jgi:hypothetical protein
VQVDDCSAPEREQSDGRCERTELTCERFRVVSALDWTPLVAKRWHKPFCAFSQAGTLIRLLAKTGHVHDSRSGNVFPLLLGSPKSGKRRCPLPPATLAGGAPRPNGGGNKGEGVLILSSFLFLKQKNLMPGGDTSLPRRRLRLSPGHEGAGTFPRG